MSDVNVFQIWEATQGRRGITELVHNGTFLSEFVQLNVLITFSIPWKGISDFFHPWVVNLCKIFIPGREMKGNFSTPGRESECFL